MTPYWHSICLIVNLLAGCVMYRGFFHDSSTKMVIGLCLLSQLKYALNVNVIWSKTCFIYISLFFRCLYSVLIVLRITFTTNHARYHNWTSFDHIFWCTSNSQRSEQNNCHNCPVWCLKDHMAYIEKFIGMMLFTPMLKHGNKGTNLAQLGQNPPDILCQEMTWSP